MPYPMGLGSGALIIARAQRRGRLEMANQNHNDGRLRQEGLLCVLRHNVAAALRSITAFEMAKRRRLAWRQRHRHSWPLCDGRDLAVVLSVVGVAPEGLMGG